MWAEKRFFDLCEAMQWQKAEAVGHLVLLWAATRDWKLGAHLSEQALLDALACGDGAKAKTLAALRACGYVRQNGDTWQVTDNARYFEQSAKMRAAGAKGGFHKHKGKRPAQVAAAPKPVAPKKPRILKSVVSPSASALTWVAYATAYHLRYGVAPRRNARVNAQLAQLVGYVGAQDAPRLAKFYVQHNSSFYVRAQHPVGALLKDYSGLATQMARGEAVTDSDVKAIVDRDAMQAQMRRLAAAHG